MKLDLIKIARMTDKTVSTCLKYVPLQFNPVFDFLSNLYIIIYVSAYIVVLLVFFLRLKKEKRKIMSFFFVIVTGFP